MDEEDLIVRLARTVTALATLVILQLVACGGDERRPTPESSEVEFLGQVNHGCFGWRDSVFNCPGTAFLRSLDRMGDTLALTIHFEANCCPQFEEHVSLEDAVLSIDVLDTQYGCRCICSYENEFRLRYQGAGDLEIHFTSRVEPQGYCVSALDTVVALPQ